MKKSAFLFALGFLTISMALSGQILTNYTTADGLPDNFICGGVAVDEDNNIWFGTAAGVARFDGSNWTVFDTGDGLPDNYILCIAVDDSNHVWAGTNFGVSEYDGSSWETLDMSDGLIDNTVKYIECDGNNRMMFATGSGLSVYNGAFTNYTSSNGLPADDVNYLKRDRDNGDVWIGTMLGGFLRISGSFFYDQYTTSNMPDLADNSVFAIEEDLQHNLWIGTWYGLTKVGPSFNWLADYDTSGALINNYVRDLKTDSYGGLWIACFADYNGEGNVSYYNGLGFTHFTINEGLADKQVIRLAVDDDDDVWVATGNGVTRISGVAGISEGAEEQLLHIAPNPAGDQLSVHSDIPGEICIYSVNGTLVWSEVMKQQQCVISTQTWPRGMYLLRWTNGTDSRTEKFLLN